MKLVFASNNVHKLTEIRNLLSIGYEILSLEDIDCNDELPETCDTLEGNALQKAQFIFEKFNCNCFADDTGLEVEALGGRPGVYSARYAGEKRDNEANIFKLLSELNDNPYRQAQFRTVIAAIINGKEYFSEGIVKGKITIKKNGNSGFGYDPVFKPDGCTKTFAEMTLQEKNKISHRAIALDGFIKILESLAVDKPYG